MDRKHITRRLRWRRLAALVIVMVALIGTEAVPSAAATSPTRSTTAAAYRDFDAVTTVREGDKWKHMALIGDTYAIFDDGGLIEGPALIRAKWPFLPEQFTRDIDAAGVYFSGPRYRWRHTWTKGNQSIVFEDDGIKAEMATPAQYDGLGNFNVPDTARIVNFAVRGTNYTYFYNYYYETPTQPLTNFSAIPERFQRDLDDVSVELEGSLYKYSFYQGNERIVFGDNGRVYELVNLDAKWPFLNSWRATA